MTMISNWQFSLSRVLPGSNLQWSKLSQNHISLPFLMTIIMIIMILIDDDGDIGGERGEWCWCIELMQKKLKVKSQAGPKPRSKFSLSVTLQLQSPVYIWSTRIRQGSLYKQTISPQCLKKSAQRKNIEISPRCICYKYGLWIKSITLTVRKIVRFQIYERSSPALLQVHIVQTQFGGGASFSVFSTPGVKNLIAETTRELETLALFKYEYEEGQLWKYWIGLY